MNEQHGQKRIHDLRDRVMNVLHGEPARIAIPTLMSAICAVVEHDSGNEASTFLEQRLLVVSQELAAKNFPLTKKAKAARAGAR
jgi:hypothetical protein